MTILVFWLNLNFDIGEFEIPDWVRIHGWIASPWLYDHCIYFHGVDMYVFWTSETLLERNLHSSAISIPSIHVSLESSVYWIRVRTDREEKSMSKFICKSQKSRYQEFETIRVGGILVKPFKYKTNYTY